MDIELEKRIKEAVEVLQQLSAEPINFHEMDPIAKMMLVAMVGEIQKVFDYVDDVNQRLVERFCTDFIPRQKVDAMPAICLLHPQLKGRGDNGLVSVGSDASFAYKLEGIKQPLTYIPVFSTSLIPHSGLYLLNHRVLYDNDAAIRINMENPNQLWVGIKSTSEVNSLRGLSMLITGTHGIMPEHIYAGSDNEELDFATMLEMENIEMVEPFDAQQSSGEFFSFVENWKENLLNMGDSALVYITDERQDRDRFKPRPFPRMFQQWLESEVLDRFQPSTIWLCLDFPEGYTVPDDCRVTLNILPVTNVDVCSVTLTQTQPIAKLQKQDESFFLRILETSTATHKQGFNMKNDEILIRDFEAKCYDNGDLYRDVRRLYNRFIDDYYAFIEYNGIKDGEVLRQLREAINRLGKSVGGQNQKFKFDSGTYVMKNMNQYPPTTSVKVSFITTMGKIGNAPYTGGTMDNKKHPALEQKVAIAVSAMGGADKATVDERYEQLRYYALTNDRLYTRMDVDAYLRKELLAEFGKDEFHRIFIKMSIQGAAGEQSLRRGLYVDIEFRDRKNYDYACSIAYDRLMEQRIRNHSCIAMPVIVTLKNLEE
jgi:ribosomal 50S subunit-associated protein YjgA (DUF615 family)